MAKKDTNPANADTTETPITEEVTEFPVTLTEFLSEIPQTRVETKAGFAALCKTEGITGHKMRAEWGALLVLFETQPTSLTWAEWATKGGN